MKLATLIKDQLSALASLEQQMTVKPSGDSATRLSEAMFADQATRIEQRIDRLKAQKSAAVRRFDTALETELAALKDLRGHAAQVLAARPGTTPAPAGMAKPMAAKPKAIKTKVAKPKAAKA